LSLYVGRVKGHVGRVKGYVGRVKGGLATEWFTVAEKRLQIPKGV
jgi:hypothetical protein